MGNGFQTSMILKMIKPLQAVAQEKGRKAMAVI
jgi:hypothetical protein